MLAVKNWYEKSAAVAIFKQLARNKLTLAAIIYIGLFWLVGLVGIIQLLLGAVGLEFPFTPYDYREQNLDIIRQGPSLAHPFGTDFLGGDMLTRVIISIRMAVMLSFLVILFGGLILPIIFGLISGYFGGIIDYLIMRVGEILDAVPGFFMILFITVSLRPRYEVLFDSFGSSWYWLIKEGIIDFGLIFLVLSVFFWVGGARIIRSQTFSLREMPYIDAARVLGASPWRIMRRHILPNLLGIIILSVFGTLASIILLDIGISFFGLGVRPPHPSFGILFSESANYQILASSPHLLIFPGVIVILYIFSLLFIEMNLNRIVSSFYSRR